jgi:hypothetical protein
VIACGAWWRSERERGAIYRRRRLAQGARVARAARIGRRRRVPCSAGLARMMTSSDKWARLTSRSVRRGGVPLRPRRLLGWAGFDAWAESVPRGLLLIFFHRNNFSFSFSFLFENFGFQKCIDLNNFKSVRF